MCCCLERIRVYLDGQPGAVYPSHLIQFPKAWSQATFKRRHQPLGTKNVVIQESSQRSHKCIHQTRSRTIRPESDPGWPGGKCLREVKLTPCTVTADDGPVQVSFSSPCGMNVKSLHIHTTDGQVSIRCYPFRSPVSTPSCPTVTASRGPTPPNNSFVPRPCMTRSGLICYVIRFPYTRVTPQLQPMLVPCSISFASPSLCVMQKCNMPLTSRAP